jgi:hypothetical protein
MRFRSPELGQEVVVVGRTTKTVRKITKITPRTIVLDGEFVYSRSTGDRYGSKGFGPSAYPAI